MSIIVRFVRFVDRMNESIGRGVAWLTLAMVLITFVVVILRYVFSIGWVWLQESYVWVHGIVFMIGAGYTLLHNGHVRVERRNVGTGRAYRVVGIVWGGARPVHGLGIRFAPNPTYPKMTLGSQVASPGYIASRPRATSWINTKGATPL